MSMNLANMIKEERLKRTFIIAVLVSTIAGTFTTGINLYDSIAEKRRQHKTDNKQDEKIKLLEKRVETAEGGKNGHEKVEKNVRQSLQQSSPQIQREYDRGYAQLGPRFAEGDLTTQTQLQGQLITLQGTVIKLLEEALVTGRLDKVNQLYNASEFAREGTIRALQDQYQRMRLQAGPGPRLPRPVGPVRRTSSTPALLRDREKAESDSEPDYHHHHRPLQKALTFNNNNDSSRGRGGPLFCHYAELLQRTSRPLDGRALANGPGGFVCPSCGLFMAIDPSRSWRIEKDVVMLGNAVETVKDMSYQVSNRFVVKCHRDGSAGYACYLCFRHRDKDTLCGTMESLMSHIYKHDIWEYEEDPDIREMTVYR